MVMLWMQARLSRCEKMSKVHERRVSMGKSSSLFVLKLKCPIIVQETQQFFA
jgi:hypothetical protein